jgi:hypothetical protein
MTRGKWYGSTRKQMMRLCHNIPLKTEKVHFCFVNTINSTCKMTNSFRPQIEENFLKKKIMPKTFFICK